MNLELKKRISTSIVLIILIYVSIFINLYVSLLALIIISILSWFEFIKMTNKIYGVKNEFVANLILILSALYLTIFSGISYYIIAIDKIYFSYIILICALSDIGGFVFGKTFRGTKLTKISPNKTISGMLGSFIFALIPCIVLKIIFLYTDLYFLSFAKNFFNNFIISFFLSLVCQLGDLFNSYFKRLADVKDTGKVLPGHGGLLDRIDGIIFAIPSFGFLGYLLNFLNY